ncbi:hypothetical protein LCGC14_1105850 [marine sediment metagenome]|uniref:DNRLRE domain-containing protein n=1 Tax=marine sediment metagenome TaxID=412755 RepID=A0A0F9MCW1_9ZZZZ
MLINGECKNRGNNWALLGWGTFWSTSGWLIAWSDNLTKLTLRLARVPPEGWIDWEAIRGSRRRCHPYWKLNNSVTIEQEELGDTREHTYNLGVWNKGELLFWALSGTIDGICSPSTSALFRSVRPSLASEITTKDASIYGRYPDWNTGLRPDIQLLSPGGPGEGRIVMQFNVGPEVPIDAFIMRAILNLRCFDTNALGHLVTVRMAEAGDFTETEVTWNDRAAGQPWDSPGGDILQPPPDPVSAILTAQALLTGLELSIQEFVIYALRHAKPLTLILTLAPP